MSRLVSLAVCVLALVCSACAQTQPFESSTSMFCVSLLFFFLFFLFVHFPFSFYPFFLAYFWVFFVSFIFIVGVMFLKYYEMGRL